MRAHVTRVGDELSRRITAVVSVICLVGGLGILGFSLVAEFPGGMIALLLVALAAVAGWQGLIRLGAWRAVFFVVASLLLVGSFAAVVLDEVRPGGVAGLALIMVGVGASKRVFAVHVQFPAAPRPQHPVVVYNVKSGGGKAVSNHLADEAQARGITPRELRPGEDWEEVVRNLVADGFDGLMAAGGDGTQALVATIASEHDLPFACIPAGTRNHFALDLGVDRDDVVGALDAFVDGWEKRVSISVRSVAGSLSTMSRSVCTPRRCRQRDTEKRRSVRSSALHRRRWQRTGHPVRLMLRWYGPDGSEQSSAAVILVSNNVYRLGKVVGAGTRASLDGGCLGIAVMGAQVQGKPQPLQQWSTPEFVIDSDGQVPLGVDGEALMMPTPLTLRVRPAALRVRISPRHPGVSPAYALPTGFRDAVRRLIRIAGGADPAEIG